MERLTQGFSCSADGTAQIANPLSKFINKILGLDGRQFTNISSINDMTERVNSAVSVIDKGLNQGMGLSKNDIKMLNTLKKTQLEMNRIWDECQNSSQQRIDVLSKHLDNKKEKELKIEKMVQKNREMELKKIQLSDELLTEFSKYDEEDDKIDIKKIKYLVENGADVNHVNWNIMLDTPLIKAVQNNNMTLVKYLVKHGANVNGESGDGNSGNVLINAYNIPMVKYLVEHGADPNKYILSDYDEDFEYNNMTYFDYLIISGNIPIIDFLIKNKYIDLYKMRPIYDDPYGLYGNYDEMSVIEYAIRTASYNNKKVFKYLNSLNFPRL